MEKNYEKVKIGNVGLQVEAFENRRAATSPRFLWHEQIEIKLVLAGEIEVFCNTENYNLCSGDLFIVNPCEVHCTTRACDKAMYHMVLIDPCVLNTTANGKCINPYISEGISAVNLIRDDERVNYKMLEIVEEMGKKEEGYEAYVKGLLMQLFTLLYRKYRKKSPSPSNTANLKRLEPVLAHMMQNYGEQISLNKMGSLSGISGKRLCTLFTETLGVSPIQYLTTIRMNKAEALLKTTSLSIGEIAKMTGYDDSLYFSRRYRQNKGLSPTESRNSR